MDMKNRSTSGAIVRRTQLYILVAIFLGLIAVSSNVASSRAQAPDAQKQATPTTGFAVKKPVFGGACPTCPWGAIATVVKAALQSTGYDLQICTNCSGAARSVRLVASAALPKPGPPDGPIDLGATGEQYLVWGYHGTHDYAKDPEGPRKQLRLLANIQNPTYLLVAAKADSGVADLHDIKDKRLPLHILATNNGGVLASDILDYYGLTKESVESWGGSRVINVNPFNTKERENPDVIISFGNLGNVPEYDFWYQDSQKYDLKYLALPSDLLDKLAANYDLERVTIPQGLLRGVDQPIPSVGRTGTVIYGRADMPDDFAYTLAKALDEHQDLLQWSNLDFSYNVHTVWKASDVPLHPGAARYYREKGYMK
jgi:TRAP-type uncharacterized transport system substrate-binding protein